MSEVVIRCPNCGTTQSALGECDACHDADTRYFCTNHTPGRWLDGPACAECGARFGVDRVRGRPARDQSADAPARARAEPPSALGSRSTAYEEPERTVDDAWTGPVHTPHRERIEEIGARDPRVEWPPSTPFPSFDVRAVPIAGCLRRLVVLFLILLALAALAFFGLLGVGSRLLFGAVEAAPTAAPTGTHKRPAPDWLVGDRPMYRDSPASVSFTPSPHCAVPRHFDPSVDVVVGGSSWFRLGCCDGDGMFGFALRSSVPYTRRAGMKVPEAGVRFG